MSARLLSRIAGMRPRPTRLLDAPRVRSLERSGGEASVQLRGVVCGVCAARSRAALGAVPGVQAATVDLASGRATLRLSPGADVDEERLQRALERAAIGMPARRLIERVARRWRRGGR